MKQQLVFVSLLGIAMAGLSACKPDAGSTGTSAPEPENVVARVNGQAIVHRGRNAPQHKGKPVPLQFKTILYEGDRVELYRPLTLDPKEVRRLNAERQKR